MSEQASGTHGPLRDEAIKRQDKAEAREYAGEWPESEEEPEDETEREAVWAPAARLAESPVPEDWRPSSYAATWPATSTARPGQ